MKFLYAISLLLCYPNLYGQVELTANGANNTYGLITSVLAPGNNPIETPDCKHASFGNHIDEIFDNDLNKHVFRFHIHVENDNDRCINFDRQRNEIKTYDKSPDNLLGIQGETVVYKWKFKLSDGFQSSSKFTHLHQLKSVGGLLASMPMYTLTARKSTPDRLELRYAETDTQITLLKTDLLPFIGTWLEVTETILYGTNGTYSITIKKISDDTTLLTYSNDDIINWREDAEFVRPKWGIYRSLVYKEDLRDETLLFADFSIEETASLSIKNINIDSFKIINNSQKHSIQVQNISLNADSLNIYTLDGKKVLHQNINGASTVEIDTSAMTNGTYALNILGKQSNQSQIILINNQ